MLVDPRTPRSINPRQRTARRFAALSAAVVTAAAFGVVVSPSAARAATAATYVIGVGGTPPAGHNIEYVDFFPRSNVNIHNGDVIDLREPATASSDDFHVPALLPQNQTVSQAFAMPGNAVIIPDSDDANANPLENLNLLEGSFAPPGSGAPGACGDATTPCVYDGSSLIDAGAMSPGQDYFVKVSLASGFTGSITLVDFGHPITDPSATVTVVADSAAASSQSDLNTAAASQLQSDTAEALAAEAAANKDSTSKNANGTTNHNVSVGASTPHTEEMEMFPSAIHASPGDTVTWHYGGTSDPHTVQFPAGVGSTPVDPFDSGFCEGTNGDTPAVNNMGPPNFGCPANAEPEEGFIPRSQGTPVIHAPSYRLVSAAGGIFDSGASAYFGSAASAHPRSAVVQALPTFTQSGYYEVTKAGGVFAYGDARFFGSAAGKTSAPVVGMVAGTDDSGYVLVASDGTFYGFGNAPQLPALGHLKSPIVGAVIDLNPNAQGPAAYVVSAGGGIFSIGAATYYGSMGGHRLNSPIVGMAVTPDGQGYWEVAADGGVFSFGDAAFNGSMGGKSLSAPITGIAATPSGDGYWLVGADGSVYPFGDAGKFAASTGHASPIVGISVTYSVASSGILINIPAGNPNDLPSRTSFTYTFPDAGTYPFQCGFHAMMTGQVIVK